MTAWIFLGLVVLLVLWVAIIYNRLIKNRNLVLEGWSGIDVQLKRRYDLIPKLVETVQGYASHEEGLLSKVLELRNSEGQAQTAVEKASIENELTQTLGRIFALAEDHPDLKIDPEFKELQRRLTEIEEQIQVACRYYKRTVIDLDALVHSFPCKVIATRLGFTASDCFMIDSTICDDTSPDGSG